MIRPDWFRWLCPILLLALPLQAGELLQTLHFDRTALRIEQLDGYDMLRLPECELSFEPGTPQLPIFPFHLLLPAGAEIRQVEILATDSQELSGTFTIYPVQKPRMLSDTRTPVTFIQPRPEIYARAQAFPEHLVTFVGTGTSGDHRLASFIAHPIQYLPTEQKARFFSRIELKVFFELSQQHISSPSQSSAPLTPWLTKLTRNEIPVSPVKKLARTAASRLQPGHFPYIIITDTLYVPDFEPLRAWKTQKGLATKIITTQWLQKNYLISGADLPILIRAFLQDAALDWGTLWVLLGGDTRIIPARTAWAMDCQTGNSRDNQIPCDLYFSDLDGSWDGNGNDIYGETGDQIDLYPDLFVGRASCDNATEIKSFVAKVISYEKNPNPEYTQRMLFAADILWHTPYTNTGEAKDLIQQKYVPDTFEITKLYAHLGNESRQSVVTAINQGMNLINHDGHAWYTSMSTGNHTSLGLSDMDNLTNKDRYATLFSIGCWPAAFDYDCIAEHFLTNPNGGGVAFIGNSRYGWGSPGNPGYGYSDRYDDAFFDFLFKQEVTNVGAALALAKARYIPYARQENVYRWCMYELNLLGDPEMPVWTQTPGTLQVLLPDSLPADAGFTVTVTDGSTPLANARVCVMNQADVYQAGVTGLDGQVYFEFSSQNPSLPLLVTTTAQNFLPTEQKIDLYASQPYLAIHRLTIKDEGTFYPDGQLNSGESIRLAVALRNYGAESLENVTARLQSLSAGIALSDSLVSYGTIAGHSHFAPDGDDFALTIDSGFRDRQNVQLALNIQSGDQWQGAQALVLTVKCPRLSLQGFVLNDSLAGNGNHCPEPGEILHLIATFKNTGQAPALNPGFDILSSDSWLTIHQGERERQLNGITIWPDSMISIPFQAEIAADCSQPHFPPIQIDSHSNGYFGSLDTLLLTIGPVGLSADFENGADGWSHGGQKDLWHLSTRRCHSGSQSWYSGSASLKNYPILMNADLTSPTIYAPVNAILSFWAWYDVALYSANGYEGDGLHVELYHDARWQSLDFIGTGGALPGALMGNDWLEYRYDLAQIPPGDSLRVRFRFISDTNDEKFEGAYVDDVRVIAGTHAVPVDTSMLTMVKETPATPREFALGQNYPNPFLTSNAYSGHTTIGYAIITAQAHLTIKIYNTLGQEIRTLYAGPQTAGNHQVHWDGRTDQGQPVGAGLYFYRLVCDDIIDTRKLLIVK